MKIPKQVKVGGFTYHVERPDRAFISNHTAADGEHNFSEKTIRVAAVGCKEYQNMVFLHEVCHAIVACYTGGMENEEHFVEQFSKGLYQVLVDNPELLGGDADGTVSEG